MGAVLSLSHTYKYMIALVLDRSSSYSETPLFFFALTDVEKTGKGIVFMEGVKNGGWGN